MKIWLNGRFVELADAKVSLFDAGFQHGVGLFETMTARNGSVFRAMTHLERLKESAVQLGLLEVLQLEPLADAIALTLDKNQATQARVRLTLTAGDLRMLKSPGVASEAPRSDPTIAIVVQPPTPYPAELFARGVRVCVAAAKLNGHDPFAGHKTVWYWPRLAELQLAASMGSAESIFFTTANRVACGAVSNIFVVSSGVVRTPPARGEGTGRAQSPVLPGVTRGVVLECAKELGLTAETGELTIDDLLAADEVFLTNSSWGVLPVVAVERTSIGAGTPGRVAQSLRKSYLEVVESETAASDG
ncbi:MAG: hypothetical protein EXS17_06430 [Phycisphaerales bacterium]|nr:hypothetical protein [Phycisphaerales bacterium]